MRNNQIRFILFKTNFTIALQFVPCLWKLLKNDLLKMPTRLNFSQSLISTYLKDLTFGVFRLAEE